MKMFIKDQNGAAVVEFAIVVSLLILLAFGICEFGLLWYNKQVVVNASREGARAGIAREYDKNGITGIVNTYCANRLITFGAAGTPTTNFPYGDNMIKSFGEDFAVEVIYNYTYLVPSIFNLGNTKTLTGRTYMKMEQEIGS